MNERTGVIVHNPDRAHRSYTLFGPDHGDHCYLMDMDGNIVHTWYVYGIHFPRLLPNGNLLYDTRFNHKFPRGLREIDWDSNEVWFFEHPIHHDAHRLPNGNTIMVGHETVYNPEVWQGICDKNCILTEIDAEGKIVWLWHADRHVEELKRLVGVEFPRDHLDWTHSNTVQVLPDTPVGQRDARFKAGNVMISHRDLDTIAIIDYETQEIVWAWGPGELDYQHHSDMQPDGNILIFDNGPHRGYSRVVEVEPLSGTIVWEYKSDPPEEFFAPYLSGQQRLPNGNTFICAGGSKDGRLSEVTPDGEVVWDFRNPFAARANGMTKIYRAYRFEPAFVEPLLARRSET